MIFHAKCPAKINLFLKLLGKRADGYHCLESLFAFLDLTDELTVNVQKETADFKLEIKGEYAAYIDPDHNLFTQILDYFHRHFKVPKQMEVTIIKNIPVGAGLGGGSSNAAFFMKALNQLFALNLSKQELQTMSLHFGSDIAFFFEDNACLVKGRGELIEKFPNFKPITTLLINPNVHLSTKEVFEKCDGKFSAEIANQTLLQTDLLTLVKKLPNDTQKAAISLAPIIGEVIQEMEKQGAEIAKMSGTGSTCFAIFNDDHALRIAQEHLTQKYPDFLIRKTHIMSHG